MAVPLTKWEKELLHIQRCAVDARCATGQELFAAVEQGQDPPDVLATTSDGRVGWELTTLALPQRRKAQDLFFEVRRRLTFQQRHRIGHLTGYFVHMWFGTDDEPTGLPYRRTDERALEALVESLVAFTPDPDHLMQQEPEPPATVSNFAPVHGPQDVTYFSVPLLGSVPTSALFSLTGAEVGLAFQSHHTARDEWAQLRRIIKKKDIPQNSVLLLSIGAPNEMGNQFPAEEVLGNFLLDHPEPIEAEHLSAVIAHFWSTGRAVNLLGTEPQEMWPALYAGMSAAHQPFVAHPEAASQPGTTT